MALVPRAMRNMVNRWTPAKRADLVLLPLAEAKQAAVERRIAAAAEASQAVAAEEVAPQLYSLTTGDGEDPAFRRITSLPTLRDLNPMMHDRMQQVCYYLRVTTPFGKRIVEIITSYVVGKGVRITCKDPRVQDVVDKFWNDDVNAMDEQLPVICDELTTFGEICLPFARRQTDGFVRLGYVDPLNVESIVFGEMETAMGTASLTMPYGVQLRREVGDAQPKVMPIVRRSEDIHDANFGRLQGECFYHTINKAKSASRGFSELFSLADWVDVFDQMMFDFADKVRMLNAFVWHYTLEGADETKVKSYRDDLKKNPPRQGGVQVTNEKVKIEAQTPEFHGNDMAAVSSMVKKYGLGGVGLPGIFFADGDDANRASALEMNAPATKKFQDRQNNLAALLQRLLGYVVDSAIQAGVLPETIDQTISIEFPEIVVRDLQKGATVLTGVAAAMSTGVEEGWVQTSTAARAFHTILAELGIDIDDSQEEYTAAQAEKESRQRKQQDGLNPQGMLDKALAQMKQIPPNQDGEPHDDLEPTPLQDKAAA